MMAVDPVTGVEYQDRIIHNFQQADGRCREFLSCILVDLRTELATAGVPTADYSEVDQQIEDICQFLDVAMLDRSQPVVPNLGTCTSIGGAFSAAFSNAFNVS